MALWWGEVDIITAHQFCSHHKSRHQHWMQVAEIINHNDHSAKCCLSVAAFAARKLQQQHQHPVLGTSTRCDIS